MANDTIMIVDDEASMREVLGIMLKKEGYLVSAFPNGEAALEHFKSNPCDLVIADMKMPGMGGVNLLKSLKAENPDVAVIMITAYASIDNAVEAMKAGAYDYFTKPFNIDDIRIHIKRAIAWKRLERENAILRKDLKTHHGFGGLVGASPKMVEIYKLIVGIASARTNVLISGESGTGKELIARAVHNESLRKGGPFVTLNCGAMPESLIESELFGYVKGAFTGATANKTGLAEAADSGTLFLDEITEMPVNLQVKLLRFIQEKAIRRVGGTSDIPVDIRIIAATNRAVEEEVKKGTFREDLFYRLNVIRIDLPPLRERREDIPKLVKHFLDKYSGEFGKDIRRVSEDAMRVLIEYDYPGNIRELENAIERGIAVETKDTLSLASLPPAIAENSNGTARAAAETGVEARVDAAAQGLPPQFTEGMDLEKTVAEFEKGIIMEALKRAGGVRTKAAELLGISFRQLRYKLAKYE